MLILLFVSEAHRALELLEDYHSKLIKPQDKQLRLAIERVIRIFKSRLFQALLGEYTLNSENFGIRGPEQSLCQILLKISIRLFKLFVETLFRDGFSYFQPSDADAVIFATDDKMIFWFNASREFIYAGVKKKQD